MVMCTAEIQKYKRLTVEVAQYHKVKERHKYVREKNNNNTNVTNKHEFERLFFTKRLGANGWEVMWMAESGQLLSSEATRSNYEFLDHFKHI